MRKPVRRLRALPLGEYIPGTSLIHRIPAGAKMVLLIVFIVATTPLHLPAACAALCLPVLGYLVARIPLRVAAGQLLPPLPIVALFAAFSWWQNGWENALTLVITLYAAISAATLLTLTTTMQALLSAVTTALRPLRVVGVNADAVALAIMLTIRLIPLLLAEAYRLADARACRGARFTAASFGVPFIIAAFHRAERTGDALIARGLADGDEPRPR
ncbi:MAG: energy-coupling factor transporter transmembrane protein EcfT [Corynebacterium sp.]|nr:energy-coupling factor transporter transmembrane protein EcfT [Corynebacterium sp.]